MVKERDQTEEGNDGENTSNGDKSYILIRKGISLSQYSNLNNPRSIESELSRGRGRGELINDNRNTEDSLHITQIDETNDVADIVSFSEGKLNTDTGFLMHFVSEEHRHFTPYDIASLPQSTAYPVKQTTLNSLPDWAKGMLHQQGHIKFRAHYNKDTQTFQKVQQGWISGDNVYDRIIELTEQLGGDLPKAFYYLSVENSSSDYTTPERIAEARDIQASSVKSAIREAEDELASNE